MRTNRLMIINIVVLSLIFGIGSAVLAQSKDKHNTTPWRDPNNPKIIILDEGYDKYHIRRDRSKDPQREAGPVNMQRYAVVPMKSGFPTYMGLPVAFTPEDLKAGKVDVAIVGIPSDVNPVGGASWAANQMRLQRVYDHAVSGHDSYLNINYFEHLNVVDYGNSGLHPAFENLNNEEHAKVLGEILDAGAVFMAIGGDHGTQAACLMAMVNKFGPKNFAVVHFDAHHDVYKGSWGMFTHGGRARRWAFENSWVKGEDMISIGMRGAYGDPSILAWQREVGERYHYMAEFERYGFETVWKRILDETKGKRLYISFDVDAIDPAHVPGVSNPDPGGLTALEAIRMVRELAIHTEVAGIEFVEYSPFLDDRHYNTAIVIDRMMRSFLGGLAARKKGITDPSYLAPDALDHGHRDK